MATSTSTLTLYRKGLKEPDLSKEFKNARVDVYKLGERAIARWTFKPGFDLSRDLEPEMKAAGCEKTTSGAEHIGYVVRGRLDVRMGDTRVEFRAGDICRVGGDHEAKVIGNEPFEVIDFGDCSMLVDALEGRKPEIVAPEPDWYPEGD